jgi:hypothetical protein
LLFTGYEPATTIFCSCIVLPRVFKTMDIKGDYEIWTNDIREYFLVSGYPACFEAIAKGQAPALNSDYVPQPAEEKAKKSKKKG